MRLMFRLIPNDFSCQTTDEISVSQPYELKLAPDSYGPSLSTVGECSIYFPDQEEKTFTEIYTTDIDKVGMSEYFSF